MKYKLTPAWTTASFKFSNKEGTDPRGSIAGQQVYRA